VQTVDEWIKTSSLRHPGEKPGRNGGETGGIYMKRRELTEHEQLFRTTKQLQHLSTEAFLGKVGGET